MLGLRILRHIAVDRCIILNLNQARSSYMHIGRSTTYRFDTNRVTELTEFQTQTSVENYYDSS